MEKIEFVFIGEHGSFVLELDTTLEALKQDILHLVEKYGDVTVRNELYRHCRTPPFVIENGKEIVMVC
ncbi:hypothetical protein DRJ17_02775 [Candidatus Woesearchaeota archaeon]|nr:MAG: hypothetical protein DRJ17_02775 [Candidatus Woesearchaeota archaeon]